MSEELGYAHAAAGLPIEPGTSADEATPAVPPAISLLREAPPPLAQQPSPIAPRRSNEAGAQVSPTPPRPTEAAASSASGSRRRFVPGGGSALASGDKPGDPFAMLVVVAADVVVGKAPRTGGPFPAPLASALDVTLRQVEAAPRSVVVVAGGRVTSSLMSQMVLRMPGGLSSFGPGKHIQAMLQERSAPWGSLWESALLVKALAKRQASTVRFGTVVVLASRCLAPATRRVYEHVFSDWRVLIDGGLAKGGRDEPLEVRVVDAVPTSETVDGDEAADTGGESVTDDEALLARSTAFDDAWFERGLATYAVHPWWPKGTALAPAAAVEEPLGLAQETAAAKRKRESAV